MSDQEETNYRLLAEYSADIICRFGLDKRFHYISPSSERVLGWTPAEMLGMELNELIPAEDLPLVEAADQYNLANPEDSRPTVVRMWKKDRSVVWMESTASVVCDPETGEPTETIVVMRDITRRKTREIKLEELALTDGLTGLWNRRSFDASLEREWKRTLREGSQISLLLLDIDHFKDVNDQDGHQVGDDCLRAVAAAVKGAVRITDSPARYGGDELAVILPGTDSTGAVEVGEKIRAAVEALQLIEAEDAGDAQPGGSRGIGCQVTVSVGAATALARVGGTIRMPESLLQAADHALYTAKREGRNRVRTALLMAPKES